MKEVWNFLQVVFTTFGAYLGYLLGGFDSLIVALVSFVIIDYITNVMRAIVEKNYQVVLDLREFFERFLCLC